MGTYVRAASEETPSGPIRAGANRPAAGPE